MCELCVSSASHSTGIPCTMCSIHMNIQSTGTVVVFAYYMYAGLARVVRESTALSSIASQPSTAPRIARA